MTLLAQGISPYFGFIIKAKLYCEIRFQYMATCVSFLLYFFSSSLASFKLRMMNEVEGSDLFWRIALFIRFTFRLFVGSGSYYWKRVTLMTLLIQLICFLVHILWYRFGVWFLIKAYTIDELSTLIWCNSGRLFNFNV